MFITSIEKTGKRIVASMAFFSIAMLAHAEYSTDTITAPSDSISFESQKHFPKIHLISADFCPGGILHTNDFLVGDNMEGRTMNHSSSVKLKYAFMESPDNPISQIYKGAYQGVGLAYHDFNPQLSYPVSAYIFQGARIVGGKRVSLNYEWNLGLTFGWNPYDKFDNPDNRVIGSKVTAYINADLYANIILNRWLDLNVGLSVSHFSNGNTSYPNMGLNTWAARMGLSYYLNRPNLQSQPTHHVIPPFHRHVSYDLVLFGSWRKRGYTDATTYDSYMLPGTYSVWGFNFNPMYNFCHWMNVGVSLDGVYDRSANIDLDYYYDATTIDNLDVHRPSAIHQMALGLSGRLEFVMPYFTINLGCGHNFLNTTGDFKGFYQTLALKLNVTRKVFLHIGYSLSELKNPRFLMLGVGYRFNNQRKWK